MAFSASQTLKRRCLEDYTKRSAKRRVGRDASAAMSVVVFESVCVSVCVRC